MATRSLADDPISLVDLVDRVLASGIVISGEIMLSVADVDLIYIGLRLVVTGADSIMTTTPWREVDESAVPST